MHHHYIDRFAYQDSPIHRLDPRAKIIAVVAYSVVLISAPRYTLPSPWLVLLPALLLFWGHVPLRFVGRHILIVSPFIFFLVAFAPVFDRTSVRITPTFEVAGGWITAASMLLRFALGMAALIALASTTRFPELLKGLERLGLPRLLVTQLRFLYRYLFLLVDQGMHLRQARDARDAGRGPLRAKYHAASGMIGVLFIRTLEGAERMHMAMLARGYDGTIRLLRPLAWGGRDSAFIAIAAVYLGAVWWSQRAGVPGA